MSSFSINDYKINNLLKQYCSYSNIFFNSEKHIDELYELNILTAQEKIQYLATIASLIKLTNKEYNDASKEITSDEKSNKQTHDEALLKELFPKSNLSHLKSEKLMDEIRYLVSINKLMESTNNENIMTELTKDPYASVKEKVRELSTSVGLKCINDVIRIHISEFYDRLYSKKDLEYLELYNKVFVPLSVSDVERNESVEQIMLEKTVSAHETIFDNCANLFIQYPNNKNKYVKINGYFEYDSLNIIVRTSIKCYDFLFKKKKAFEQILTDRTDINEKFKSQYIRCATICDIMGQTESEFEEQLENDYKRYRDLIKYSFMGLMKDFIKSSLKEMQITIKLLLMGDEDKANNAKLLFALTKDKKEGPETVANFIYQSLPYMLQAKLKKTGSNIKAELEKIKSLSMEDVDFKKQIALCNNMPTEVKKSALEKVEEMKASNNEYYKQLLYVKTLLNFPWPSSDEDTFFEDIGKDVEKSQQYLKDVTAKLNDKVYGHQNCKDSIERMIGKWLSNPASSGSAIGLQGPPGVGKTLIAKGIGDALGIPFVQIALGGQNDGEILHGHGYTYSSAQPGMVVKKMVEAGSARCVMYFDELDKACKKHDSNEIYNILIHMTDPNMNGEFQDRFFQEIKFPLSKVIFIFSYNDESKIDPILLDRMEKISVEPYSLHDKVHISKGFLMKELCKNMGYEYESVKFDDKTLEFLAEEYTLEAGVRELKRKMDTILMKLNIDRIFQRGMFKNIKTLTKSKPVKISKDLVIEYLEKPQMEIETIHTEDMVGVINGLYATTTGKGGIIPIQIQNNKTGDHEKFTLKLTGSQGAVMKESIAVAFTTAINYISDEAREKFLKSNHFGFHVHTPSTATPKDGPSAGCAFATAFISRLLNKPIHHYVGMTGEIDMINQVTKIGGLLYKLTGSKKAGVKLVLVSAKNKDDLEQIKKKNPNLIKGDFKVKLVETLADVLKEAIVGFEESDVNPKFRHLNKTITKKPRKPKQQKDAPSSA